MNRLKELRKETKYSLRDLEKLTGIANSTISEMETGKRKMNMNHAFSLASVLGCDPFYLLGTDAISIDGSKAQGYKTLISSMLDELLDQTVVQSDDEVGKKLLTCSFILSEWISDKDINEILDIVTNKMERNKKACE